MLFQLTRQVFVANPNKPPEIARILKRNKERLLVFLKDFHNDKEGEYERLRHGRRRWPMTWLWRCPVRRAGYINRVI